MRSHCRLFGAAGTIQLGAIWLLFGGKAGDNAQVEALAAALADRSGWHYRIKQLRHHPAELSLHLLSRPTLAGITRASRAGLEPPWPDLVITAGRRNELVALWIKERSPATRVVHIGRPWCRPSRFDLVVTTPQYSLQGEPNVLLVELPLNQVDGERIREAREAWRNRLGALPSPRTVLLVGGASGGYVFDDRQAARLAERVNTLLVGDGGSLLLSTSRRTPGRFVNRLRTRLRAPDFAYGFDDAGPNPYYGLLAWGERFVVTEDSVSMVAEAMATGRDVFIAPIDSARPDDGTPWWRNVRNFGWKPLTHRLAQTFAPVRFHRDVRRLYEGLVAAGELRWLADSNAPTHRDAPAPGRTTDEIAALRQQARLADLDAAVSKVEALFGA